MEALLGSHQLALGVVSRGLPSGAAALGLGLGLLYEPRAAVAAAIVFCVMAASSVARADTERVLLIVIGLLLAGYALMGRGFAYVGFERFFVGDVVLATGIAAALARGVLGYARRSAASLVLLAFCVWGVIRTVPYLGDYGWWSLRDAAIWGYASFAFLICGALLQSGTIDAVIRAYRRFLPILVLCLPLGAVLYRLDPWHLPRIREGMVPVIQMEPGDTCVHLTGAAMFVLLGLHRGGSDRNAVPAWVAEWLFWVTWIAGAFIASSTRGGLLALLAGLAVVLALRPRSRWGKFVLVAILVTMVWMALDLEIDLGGGRNISPQQIVTNLSSVVGLDTREGAEGSRGWRLRWWGTILDYTLSGPHFWTGKGFGINLADADGFQVFRDSSLRSPHSAHMNVLARMGVPGLVLWLAFLGLLAARLLRCHQQAARGSDETRGRLIVWILGYWVAFLVNMSFDLTLEGPHGGIWFWSLSGAALALVGSDSATSSGREHVD